MRSSVNRCTEGLKSTRPNATHTTERIGRPTSSAVSLISLRVSSSMSSGSSKTSYVSNPISLALRMPSSVPISVPNHVELIIPSSSFAISSILRCTYVGWISSTRTTRFSSIDR
jgi:hypothetical protein